MTQETGQVIWITGLSGAGKSTLAEVLVEQMRARNFSVVMLDGDELREVFGSASIDGQKHQRDERLKLASQYGRLCRVIARQGLTVVIATISLFEEVHTWNRRNLPGYFDVYLKVPLEELRRRDPKGLYRRFDAGEISHMAGLDLPVDEPEAAMMFEFDPLQSMERVAETIMAVLTEKKKDRI